MRRSLLLLSILLSGLPLYAQSIVLMNGSVIDGTGKPRIIANVRVRDGKVVDIGPVKPLSGEMAVDVKGMIVAPGFIDIRTLSPGALGKDPATAALIKQGVTTAILGADGSGLYSVEDFMLPFDDKPPALNIAMLVGHTTIRKQILGPDYKRTATADEVRRMGELVSDAMKQGAFGLASDLQQEPSSFSAADELMAVAKSMAKFGGTLVMTLRNESDKVGDAVKEAVNLAREAKIPVQVLTENKAALAEIEKARLQKVDIASDSFSFTQLVAAKGVGLERAIQRLSGTPAARLGLRERGILKKGDPADIVVFNPNAIATGLKYVLVNGTIALKDGEPTEARAGQALR